LTAAYASDMLDRVTNITYRTAGGGLVRSFAYAYDASSLITQKVTEAGDGQTVTNAYAYDGLGRLVAESRIQESGVSSESYTYDLAGNRLSVSSAVSVVNSTFTHNRLTAASDGTSLAYDAAGNVTGMVRSGVTLALAWNAQRQLVSVSTNGAFAESYAYDALGRRVRTTDSGGTVYHVYDGDECVADTDASGNPLRSYLWGQGIDNLLAMTVYTYQSNSPQPTASCYYAVKDHLGSVHALVDESGNAALTVRYDTWGTPQVSSFIPHPSSFQFRYLFQGREYSFATGLYNFRARWYEPRLGRWMSNDPIGISGGLNLYVAVNNNPVNFVDKDGESAIAAADYWADMAGGGYNQGGFGGWWKVQTGNTMGMFINMWHAQEMEEHAGLAGEYWDECKGKSAKHMAAVGGYAVLDYVQFTGLQKLGGLTGEGRLGTRIFQLRNKSTGRPVFRLDKGPVPGKVGAKWHYHRPPDLTLHRPYQGGL